MTLDSPLSIQVNGAAVRVPPGTTLAAFLEADGLSGPGIAVAVNDAVVRRADLDARVLVEGDRVEIIRAVGGG
ncbi:MAG TPA: sulfur carrier protein ThiS [Candidatus Eisenbacteria bacterium]